MSAIRARLPEPCALSPKNSGKRRPRQQCRHREACPVSRDLAAYDAAKAGIIGLTRAAALDLADHGITVNAIAPGPIETELMLGVWTAEGLKERPQHGAIARFGTVDEIAHTALFLAAPHSGFITGITVSVDGGAVAAGAYMVEMYRRRRASGAT